MTGVDEVTPESFGQSSGAYEAYSHDGVPLWTGIGPCCHEVGAGTCQGFPNR